VKSRVLSIAVLATGLAMLATPAPAATDEAVEISLVGAVDPLAARYVERGIQTAEARDAAAVLIRIDTPGGLDSSMRRIIRSIEAATVPVVCWVGPPGARAASAGAIIMLACPSATMAPGTNIGAAHPVGLTGEVLADKITNDAAAYVRALAQQRNRNVEVAEAMVRSSTSISAVEAEAGNVIDAIAEDRQSALRSAGVEAGVTIVPVEMTVMESLLHNAVDPNIAFLLLIIGLLGIVSEVLHPGITIGGLFGGVALIAALVILGMLPVNIAGVLMIFAGVGLMVAEAYVPGGVAGAAGLTSLVLGGLFLFDASVPNAQVSKGVLVAIVLVVVAFFLFIMRALVRTRRMGPSTPTTADLIGLHGIVETALDPVGVVRARNESWTGRATGGPIPAGATVRVTGVDGLTLEVEQVTEPSGVDA
jgi:membrane-bound serine protease (ClpP class)